MIVDGKKIAEGVYARLPKKSATLGILVGRSTPVIESFVRIKEKAAQRLGVVLKRHVLIEGASTGDAEAAVWGLAQHSDGVIVQLPLPEHVDTDTVLSAIPPEKDVDGIAPGTHVLAPVIGAFEEILRAHAIGVRGKRVLVVGQGRLVGAPAATWFRKQLAHVTVITDSINLPRNAKEADIIVLGTGAGNILTPDMVREGVVIFDAGTSEQEGKLTGDADPLCAEVASLFTPVPGGIGPIAVAMIFKNLYDLMEKR